MPTDCNSRRRAGDAEASTNRGEAKQVTQVSTLKDEDEELIHSEGIHNLMKLLLNFVPAISSGGGV